MSAADHRKNEGGDSNGNSGGNAEKFNAVIEGTFKEWGLT